MNKSFAERIIDSIVDENGRCSDRGLSRKQGEVLITRLQAGETEHTGGWRGDYSGISFSRTDYTGKIGRYEVTIRENRHFHVGYEILEIAPWIDTLPDTSNSTYVGDLKQRLELPLMLLGEHGFERACYCGYGYEWVRIYRFVDKQGNVFVWQTTSVLVWWDEEANEYRSIEPGMTCVLRGTVKAHKDYRGENQTVLTRCKVQSICE